MKFIYGKNSWRNIEQGEENCYLLGNGLGGFSSLTITGANARNDHALLIASVKAPVVRYHMVSNIHACVVHDEGYDYLNHPGDWRGLVPMKDHVFDLAAQRYVGRTKNQEGYKYLQSFVYEYLPQWQFKAQDVDVTQTVCVRHGENTVIVRYDVDACSYGYLLLIPWMQFVVKGEKLQSTQTFEMDDEKIQSNDLTLYYKTNGTVVKTKTAYVDDWYYDQDARDGRDAVGCAASNHRIECRFVPGSQSFYVVYSMNELKQADDAWAACEMQAEIDRQKTLEKTAGLKDPIAQVLTRSANQYLTWRDSTKSMSVMAGFPFFGDWGRDTMIAMVGCTISAKQFESAKSILRTFMAYCHKGIMPNMFPEDDGEPMYNTVDASLLFIEVVYLYCQASGDWAFLNEAWPVMKDIVYWYSHGTDYHIYMDKDGLIYAGEGLYQLTWMDVRVGEILPTPRHGKPVEINAYWYNALKIMETLAPKMADSEAAVDYGRMAALTKQSFLTQFWDEAKGYLKDVISGTDADAQIRCNQIWALTLSFVMPDQSQAQRILQTVYKHLYTPWGLRSLSPMDKEYHPDYGGAQFYRDMAYHQGTVWGYPLGAYYLAYLRWADDQTAAITKIRGQLMAMEACLREGCIGHIAEIYDGECPNISQGCFAQAWSVGEILRVYEKLEEMEGPK